MLKKDKELVLATYDYFLDKLPHISSKYTKEEISKIKSRIRILNIDDKFCLKKETTKIRRMLFNIKKMDVDQEQEVIDFIYDPEQDIKCTIDNLLSPRRALTNFIHIESKYEGIFRSSFNIPKGGIPLVKISFSPLGAGIYTVSEEVIFVETPVLEDTKRRIFNYVKEKNQEYDEYTLNNYVFNELSAFLEYQVNPPHLVDDLESYQEFLSNQYGVDINLASDEDKFTNVGYEAYDNRVIKHGKVKSIRKQYKSVFK